MTPEERNYKENVFVRFDGRSSYGLWGYLFFQKAAWRRRRSKREHILGGGERAILTHRTWSYVRFSSAASVLSVSSSWPTGCATVALPCCFYSFISPPPPPLHLSLSPSTLLALLQQASVLKVCVSECVLDCKWRGSHSALTRQKMVSNIFPSCISERIFTDMESFVCVCVFGISNLCFSSAGWAHRKRFRAHCCRQI